MLARSLSPCDHGTFLGARYRRIVKHRGHAKAVVAVARSILVITWHLFNEPDAHYQELGADRHQRHLNPGRKTRDLVRPTPSPRPPGHPRTRSLITPTRRPDIRSAPQNGYRPLPGGR